ncbi:TPR-like protein [Auriculariales sp. MPI-PUGE-AT-0066]|nr:TPR-like protein [Auriculariales sp. MPI-PUGE-AT-0066]
MAFQAMMSGAECATGANPLSQVLKHADNDRSLQRDRITAGPSSSLYRLAPSSAQAPSEADVASARQFFASQPGPSAHVLGPHAMGPPHLPQAMSAPPGPDMASAWQAAAAGPAFAQQAALPLSAQQHAQGRWANEFELQSPAVQAAATASSTFRPQFMMQRNYSPMMAQTWTPPPQAVSTDKGKGRMTEADFEAAFAQFEKSTEKTADVDALTEELQGTALGGDKTWGEYQRAWEEANKDGAMDKKRLEELAKWEDQYNQLNTDGRIDEDFVSGLSEAYSSTFDQYDQYASETRTDEHGNPQLGTYEFDKDNQYMKEAEQSSRSHLQDAKDLLATNGSLTEAALLLEAAIQKGDLGRGGYEAWVLLGETRSMDEREEQAMRALVEGTRLSAAAGEPAEGLIPLAIAYTNESYDRAAHHALLNWLVSRYPGTAIPADEPASPWASLDRAREAFLGVARGQHAAGAQVDPDLQAGLGVLFYSNGEFDRARDCFETALGARPNDYLLWNRLGSCLSNDSKPEEALGAYRHALQLRPTYTRAIYNVGVACLNIGAYEEAAKHFLSALAMHDSNGAATPGNLAPAPGEQSVQLRSTLQRCFTYMNRSDLAEMVRQGAPVESFRLEGFDF